MTGSADTRAGRRVAELWEGPECAAKSWRWNAPPASAFAGQVGGSGPWAGDRVVRSSEARSEIENLGRKPSPAGRLRRKKRGQPAPASKKWSRGRKVPLVGLTLSRKLATRVRRQEGGGGPFFLRREISVKVEAQTPEAEVSGSYCASQGPGLSAAAIRGRFEEFILEGFGDPGLKLRVLKGHSCPIAVVEGRRPKEGAVCRIFLAPGNFIKGECQINAQNFTSLPGSGKSHLGCGEVNFRFL